MQDEPLLTFHTAAELLGDVGRSGGPLHPSTLRRWSQTGVQQPDGTIRKLKATRVGGKWVTTRTWLNDFLAPPTDSAAAPEPRSPAERRRNVDAAMKQLEAIGA
jgi:hypothetical protein